MHTCTCTCTCTCPQLVLVVVAGDRPVGGSCASGVWGPPLGGVSWSWLTSAAATRELSSSYVGVS